MNGKEWFENKSSRSLVVWTNVTIAMPLVISSEIVPKVITGDRDNMPFRGLKGFTIFLSLIRNRMSSNHKVSRRLRGIAERAPRKSLLYTKGKGSLRIGLQMRMTISMYW